MKIPAKTLKALVSHAKLVSDPKSVMPILSCVRLEADSGVLHLDAIDLPQQGRIQLTLRAPCGGILAPIVVNLRQLAAVVSDAKGKDRSIVSIEVLHTPAHDGRRCPAAHSEEPKNLCARSYNHEGEHSTHGSWKDGTYAERTWTAETPPLPKLPDDVIVRAGVDARMFTLPAFRTEDFPKLKHLESQDHRSYEAAPLADTLGYVLPAAGTYAYRTHLCGVWIAGRRFFAVDGHRVHVDDSEDRPTVTGAPVFIHARSAATLLRLLGAVRPGFDAQLAFEYAAPNSGSGSAHLCLKDEIEANLAFTWQDVTPPSIDQVIPETTDLPVRAAMNAKAFSEACQRAEKARRNRSARCEVNGAFKISAGETGEGESTEEVPAESEGSLSFEVNPRFLAEAAAGLGEFVTLRARDAKSPLRLDGTSSGRFAIVMPVVPR